MLMSIVGGAVMTPIMGLVADGFDMRIGFLIPLLCFGFVAAYGASWPMPKAKDARPRREDPTGHIANPSESAILPEIPLSP
ncbi:MAG TPA: hypothetical protein VN718_05835 [Rhizomicrobium sp.]|nr:hypothetical protein [Rhizomicrobium sp.]